MPRNKSTRSTRSTRSYSKPKSYSKPRSYSKSKSKLNSNKPTYVYSLNQKGGRKYVGLTQNPNKRFNDHYNGNGH